MILRPPLVLPEEFNDGRFRTSLVFWEELLLDPGGSRKTTTREDGIAESVAGLKARSPLSFSFLWSVYEESGYANSDGILRQQ
jgi:hypothetical protein